MQSHCFMKTENKSAQILKEIMDLCVLPFISKGDILAFKSADTYSFSITSNYNSRFRP